MINKNYYPLNINESTTKERLLLITTDSYVTMQCNIPTLLTIFRIVLIPFFVLTFYFPIVYAPFTCALIFLVAAITDWFDGYLARLWNQITYFGIFLDPVADKIMVVTATLLITERHHIWWVTLPSITIVIREVIISALREWMARIDKYKNITVSRIGKTKTTIQMIALIWMLWSPNIWIEWIGISLLWVAAILTLLSMLQYLNISRSNLLRK